MSTGVESFQELAKTGAIYPFQGSEVLLVILAIVFWVGWHIWQLKNEADEYNVETREIRDKAQANKVLNQ